MKEPEIKQLEKRISILEKYREQDKNQIHSLDTSLQVFINEMKNISQELKNIVKSFKETLSRTTENQQKEILYLQEKNDKLEAKVEKLDNKIEQETVVANANKWKSITSYTLTAILGSIITFILVKIGLK